MQIVRMRMYLVFCVAALRPPEAPRSGLLRGLPPEFLQTGETSGRSAEKSEVPDEYLSTGPASHAAEAAGIGDLSPGKGARTPVPWRQHAAGLRLREVLAVLGLGVGIAAAKSATPAREIAIADEPATKPLVALQVCAALAALFGQALLVAPAMLILTDATAHTALLLRGVLGFVEAKHGSAVQQYRRRLVGWSVWLDLRAHLAAVAAVVAWSTSSLALVLFVLVSMGRRQLFPWAWWASHAVLSVAVLGLAVSAEKRHPSQPSLVWLLCNCVVGGVYGGPFAPAADVVLVVVPLLQLAEAFRAWRHAEDRSDLGQESQSYDCQAPTVERQLLATLQGNQDSADFEAHLAAERRLCELYCFQDLLTCEGAPSAAELLDRYRKWSAQFATDRAPLAVRNLPPLDDAVRVELCPQASVHRAKQALLGTLRAPYARFLARKRRAHLSAGCLEIKPPGRLALRSYLGYKPEESTTVV